MKGYYYKTKNKDIFINCIKIISVFIIAQLLGVILVYKYFSGSLIMTLISLISMNILAYYVTLK
ncbi:MAG: hypothetical protein ACRDA3_15170 [Peptostreptococcaceae bacterium]